MKKNNNKGFSLIELIIVIAIMAILIGVLAPQYIKYVEKSRVSSDKDTLDAVYDACTAAASDPDVDPATIPSAGTGYTIADLDTSYGATPAAGYTTTWGKEALETLSVTNSATIVAKLKAKVSTDASMGNKTIKIEVDDLGNFKVICNTISVPDR